MGSLAEHGNHKIEHERFSIGYDSHARWWRWRERKPDPQWKAKKHKIQGKGFANRRAAMQAALAELARRERRERREAKKLAAAAAAQ